MKLIILRGKFTKKLFGVQLIVGHLTVQIAYWKFGIYNHRTYKWWPDDTNDIYTIYRKNIYGIEFVGVSTDISTAKKIIYCLNENIRHSTFFMQIFNIGDTIDEYIDKKISAEFFGFANKYALLYISDKNYAYLSDSVFSKIAIDTWKFVSPKIKLTTMEWIKPGEGK
jgi:hypothetical protein